MAASWPCATAQMMFFGPKAASPPKNTFGIVDCSVVVSSCGRPHSSKSRPMSRSIQGKWFSWPTAIRTSSHSTKHVRLAGGQELAATAGVALRLDLLETHALQRAVFVHEGERHHEIEDGNALVDGILLFPGLAFISSKPERTITFTVSPPRRRELRQQSIAVLPPPSTITRRPDLFDVPEGHRRQPVDADMDVRSRLTPAGQVEGRARAARRSRRTPRRNLGEHALQRIDALAADELHAEVEDVAALLVDHRFGQAESAAPACA
jgi:hypothetical protein